MSTMLPEWLQATNTSREIKLFTALLEDNSPVSLELLAQKARTITQRHFGKTISLYAPLYLSNYCQNRCLYCGFAADREQTRRRLSKNEYTEELKSIKEKGIEDILLLTGGRSKEADFDYLLSHVSIAAKEFHNVSIESFAMSAEEYSQLFNAGCTGVTIYQETYDPDLYSRLHRSGDKMDFTYRIEAPERALSSGMRTIGTGVLLGLADPLLDSTSLFKHTIHLRKKYWKAGMSISFPRICSQQGTFTPSFNVSDTFLARIIFAFRICMNDVPLVLSTRESPAFRDGMAGVGISRMSVDSRTSVGGYSDSTAETGEQFSINDERGVAEFCEMISNKELEPVFKNWDSVFQKL